MSSDTPPPAGPRAIGPLLAVGLLALDVAPVSASDPPRFQFTRLVAHWDQYADPGYLKFVEDARPEVAQVGFYGGHFWSLGQGRANGDTHIYPNMLVSIFSSRLQVAPFTRSDAATALLVQRRAPERTAVRSFAAGGTFG